MGESAEHSPCLLLSRLTQAIGFEKPTRPGFPSKSGRGESRVIIIESSDSVMLVFIMQPVSWESVCFFVLCPLLVCKPRHVSVFFNDPYFVWAPVIDFLCVRERQPLCHSLVSVSLIHSVSLCICLSRSVSQSFDVFLSECVSVSASVCLSVSVSLSVCLCLCLSVCLSLSLSLSLSLAAVVILV